MARAPKGFKTCIDCGRQLPKESFNSYQRTSVEGKPLTYVNGRCKECHARKCRDERASRKSNWLPASVKGNPNSPYRVIWYFINKGFSSQQKSYFNTVELAQKAFEKFASEGKSVELAKRVQEDGCTLFKTVNAKYFYDFNGKEPMDRVKRQFKRFLTQEEKEVVGACGMVKAATSAQCV